MEESMGATLWVLLVALGWLQLIAMKFTGSFVDGILKRTSAWTFMGAGVVGAAGIMGAWISDATAWAYRSGGEAGAAVVGTAAVVWISVALLGGLWVLVQLPYEQFKMAMPPWLAVSGVFLPSLLRGVPGPAGNALRAITTALGHLMITAFSSLFGM